MRACAIFAGLGAIGYGCYLVHPGLGWIAGGVLLGLAAVATHDQQRREAERAQQIRAAILWEQQQAPRREEVQ